VTTQPTPCRKGSYQPSKGQQSIQACLPCPAGYFCDSIGISDYKLFPCPTGHYCKEVAKVTPPSQCKAGTYQPYLAKSSSNDCLICPEGHFCLDGVEHPEPCDAGYICEKGSKKQYACQPGTYCPTKSAAPLDCPQGFYCPGYRTDIYAKCTNGTFCGNATRFPESCPAGYFGSSNTSNFDLNSGCFSCGSGQYSNSGSNSCEDCYAGFVCEKGARKPNPRDRKVDGGYECPAGYYCPVASVTPIACPLGHYSETKGNGYANQCKPCPENFFGIEVGATSCRKCQGATVSDVGSTSCRCQGLNRKYLADQGKCVCRSGFEPVDGTRALDDGFADCSLIIYATCRKDEVRDAMGNCRKDNSCDLECDGGEGQVQVGFGICQCNKLTKVEDILSIENLERRTQMTFSDNNQVVLYDPVTKNKQVT